MSSEVKLIVACFYLTRYRSLKRVAVEFPMGWTRFERLAR